MAAKNLIIEYKYSKGNTTLVWYKHKEKKKEEKKRRFTSLPQIEAVYLVKTTCQTDVNNMLL